MPHQRKNVSSNQITLEVIKTIIAILLVSVFVTAEAYAGVDAEGNIRGGASIAPTLSGIIGGTQVLGFTGYENGGVFQWETLVQNVRFSPNANGRDYISSISLVAATSVNLSLTQVLVSSSVTFNLLEYTPGNILEGRIIPFRASSLSVVVTETALPGLFISTSDGRTLQASQVNYDFSSSTQAAMDSAGFFFNTDKAYSYAIGATFAQGQLFRTYLFNPNASLVANGANVSRTQRATDSGPILTFGVNGEGGVDVKLSRPTSAETPEPGSLLLVIAGLLPCTGILRVSKVKGTVKRRA